MPIIALWLSEIFSFQRSALNFAQIRFKDVCYFRSKELLLELVCGDGYPYGYGKLTASLQEDYEIKINHKKVYRFCKELDILRPQWKTYPKRPRKIAKKME